MSFEKMNTLNRILAISVSGLAACLSLGCATPLRMTYTSIPPGAALYQGSTFFGYCPVTLEYNPSRYDVNTGRMMLQEVTAVWSSGAKVQTGMIQADLRQHGFNQYLSLPRPADVPGAEIDAQFAIELERNAIMHQQLANQRRMAAMQFSSMMSQQNYQNQQLMLQRQQLSIEQQKLFQLNQPVIRQPRSGSGTI